MSSFLCCRELTLISINFDLPRAKEGGGPGVLGPGLPKRRERWLWVARSSRSPQHDHLTLHLLPRGPHRRELLRDWRAGAARREEDRPGHLQDHGAGGVCQSEPLDRHHHRGLGNLCAGGWTQPDGLSGGDLCVGGFSGSWARSGAYSTFPDDHQPGEVGQRGCHWGGREGHRGHGVPCPYGRWKAKDVWLYFNYVARWEETTASSRLMCSGSAQRPKILSLIGNLISIDTTPLNNCKFGA